MSLGVLWEVVLSRWEMKMTRLRAVPTTPRVSIENHWGEANRVLVVSVGCVMKRSFEWFVKSDVLR